MQIQQQNGMIEETFSVLANKDWTGNNKTVFTTLGASSHSDGTRQKNDFYATEPNALEQLLKQEQFNNVWECACGEGHLSKVLIKHNIHGLSTDYIDRGFGQHGIDFLSFDVTEWAGDIVTNPPFKYSLEFVEKALRIINSGNKVAMLLRIQFLESKSRQQFLKINPPKTIYVSSSRIICAKNGEFEKYKSSAMCFCWFVWERGYTGDTVIKLFN